MYTRYMAADPYARSVSPLAQETFAGLFPEIAGAYIVGFLANPTHYASFRDYMVRLGYKAGFDNSVKEDFQELRRRGLLPNVGESLFEYSQRRSSDPCIYARSQVFVDDDIMTLLAVAYARSRFNPVLKNYVDDATLDGIHRLRFNDPTTPLIYWILEYQVEQ